MNKYIYEEADYGVLLNRFACMNGIQEDVNQMSMPASMGEGFLRWAALPGGMSALISDCTYANDFRFERKGGGDFFVLQFDDVCYRGKHTRSIDFFTPRQGHVLERHKHARVQSVKVILTFVWLEQYLYPGAAAQLQSAMERVYEKGAGGIKMPADMQVLLQQVTTLPDNSGRHALYLQNRILLLLERFLELLAGLAEPHTAGSKKEAYYISRVKETGQLLAGRLYGAPPCIEELARGAAMSATSYKKYFKQVYGLPVYRYYLQLRLQEARKLLRSGAYTVNEAGIKMGYSTTHHFTHAYRKEFGHDPHYEINTL